MADIEDKAVSRYLQEAHNRGGGWGMAMRMMARRILVLEDRLIRAGVDFPDAPGIAPEKQKEGAGCSPSR